jgi:uncharacterized protein YkwD
MKCPQLHIAQVLICLMIVFAAFPISAAERNSPNLDLSALEKKIHTLVNEERKKQGLSGLKWNERLNRAARAHSADMASRNFFSHETPEKENFGDRYRRFRAECRLRVGSRVHMGGENISQDNLFESVTYRNGIPSYKWKTSDEIAESVVRRWMTSPNHRKNILAPHWKTEGIGVAVSGKGEVLVTQNFC